VDYATLKWVHIGAVTVSFCGFAARGYGAFSNASWVRHRLARILPVAVDTVLLLSAVGMLWLIRLSPWSQPWLRAKLESKRITGGADGTRIGRSVRGTRNQ
jgi:uncharacterized membrane protein SirB2